MFCKKCGKQISDDSVFCSHCGTKQDSCVSSSASEKDKRLSIIERLKYDECKDNVVNIPEGHIYCPYCGRVKPENEFDIDCNAEYQICKKCSSREKKISRLPVTVGVAIFIIISIIGYVEGGWTGALGAFAFVILGVIFIPGFLLYMLLEKLLENTSLRISLSKKRRKFLEQCTDNHGNPLIAPIKRSEYEEMYHNATGVYLSRDVKYGFYKCPCCSEQFPINESKIVEGSDNRQRHKSSWIGGARIEVIETKYKYRICTDCHKYRRTCDKILLWSSVIGAIIAPLIYIYIEQPDSLAFVFILAGLFIGVMIGWIIKFIYKLFVKLVYKKDLFVTYYTAAENGALTSID